MEFWEQFWLILGGTLVLAEILLPGGIAFFVGLSAICVAGMYFLDLIESPLTGFSIWFMFSVTFFFLLKGFVDKMLPHTETRQNTDEDMDAFGTRVKVLSPITHETVGRIEFQGTSWPAKARSQGTKLIAGDFATIVFRENMTWLVDAEQQDTEIKSSNEIK